MDIYAHPIGGGGGAAWGDVTGTLADQTDLQTALDAKSASDHDHDGTYEPADAAIQSHIAAAHAPANAQKNSDITKAEIEAKLTGTISSHSHAGGGGEAFPVGAIFIAAVDTDPATLLGYGTWAAFGAGRVLVGIDAGQTEFDTGLETGGVKTHTLTEAEIPSHVHGELAPSSASSGALKFAIDTNASGSQDAGISTAATGGGGAHNNLQPYIVVWMWERTA